MIYLRLAGGLGNQLFQLAAASLISQKWRIPIGLITNSLSCYSVKRNPDSLCIVSHEIRAKFVEVDKSILVDAMVNKCRIGRWLPWFTVNDGNYWEKINHPPKKTFSVMDGYFQCGWRIDCLNKAVDGLEINPYKRTNLINSDEVVIHIRGGDFRSSPLGFIGQDYYIRCAKMAFDSGWRKFAVISDDFDFSRTICDGLVSKVEGLKLRYIEGSRVALEDFNLLRGASARIIGNSTFALWATLLGSAKSPTWSPSCLQRGLKRGFKIDNEITVDV